MKTKSKPEQEPKPEPKTSFCHNMEQMVVVPTRLLQNIRKWTFDIYYNEIAKQFCLKVERYSIEWIVEHPTMTQLNDSTYVVGYDFPERVAEDVRRRCYQILRILHDQQKEQD